MIKRLCLLIILGCCFVACGNRQIHQSLEALYHASIQFPDSLEMVINGSSEKRCVKNLPIKLVSYYPPGFCTSCTVNQVEKWKPLFDSVRDDRFVPLLLFSPGERGYRSLIAELKLSNPPYPVYVDMDERFQTSNPAIPSDSRYHTLLLDRDNRVVLVGNPLASDTMWSLFRRTLDNMLANDGVYVSE